MRLSSLYVACKTLAFIGRCRDGISSWFSLVILTSHECLGFRIACPGSLGFRPVGVRVNVDVNVMSNEQTAEKQCSPNRSIISYKSFR
jgi:hypothetical protein